MIITLLMEMYLQMALKNSIMIKNLEKLVMKQKSLFLVEDSGSMDFKIVFSRDNILLKNESYGFATYHGTTIRVDDMSE